MKDHGANRQKKLAQKKAKREQKRASLAKRNSKNPALLLARCGDWPIVEALESGGLWESGMGQVILARRAPGGKLATVVFLLDVYCLGVKNAFWAIQHDSEYRGMLSTMKRSDSLQVISPERAKKIIEGAIAYARAMDFSPHPDYARASRLLEGIDPARCSDSFTYGKDGKPFYVRGPHESLSRAEEIISRIQARGGSFIVGSGTDFISDREPGELEDEGFYDEDEDSNDVEDSGPISPLPDRPR
jgi:hypothetical protein